MERSIFSFLFLMILAGCQPEELSLTGGKFNSISGSVLNFSSLSSASFVSASSTCNGESASLYSLDTQGKKEQLLAEATVNGDGNFQFTNVRDLGVQLSRESFETKYLIEFSCGTTLYQRFVTGTTDQKLGDGTTLLAWTSQTTVSSAIRNQSASSWIDLFQSLESAGSVTTAFSTLNSDLTLKSKFQTIFGTDPTILNDAVPSIQSTTVPSSWNEEAAQGLSVQAVHWSSGYNVAYAWKIGSTTLSTSSNFTHTPSANAQGTYTLQLFIGQNDGSGGIDTTKPYTQKTFPISIQNTVLPTVPSLSRVSSQYSASTAATLRIATGALVDGRPQNCKTFSYLSIVEEGFPAIGTAPLLPASYNIDCTSANQQDLNVTLSGAEGIRTFRLWARDAAGNISTSSQDVTVILDQTNPSVSLTSLTGGQALKGGSTAVITWSSTELNPASNPITLEYSTDNGGSWISIASSTSNSGSYSWTVPSLNTSTARVRVTMLDLAGNTGAATSSSAFIIDSTPPTAPVISRTSSAISNSTTVGIGTTCDADYDKILYSESSTTPAVGAAGWETCAATKNFTVSSGDGSKTIYAFTMDLAGNISSSSSISMTLDQTNPVINVTSLNSGIFKGGSSQTLTWSLAEANWGAQPVSFEYSSDNGSNWTSLLASTANDGTQSITLPSIDSTQFKIRVSGCDLAGNCSNDTSNSSLTVDSTPPAVSNFQLAGGAASTSVGYINVNLQGSDTLTKITEFCIKSTQGAVYATPAANDSCWRNIAASPPGLTPALAMNMTSYNYLLGFTPGSYHAYVWLKDEAGQISTLSNSANGTIGVDKYSINYQPGSPPNLVNVISANSDISTASPTSSDLTIAGGSDVYIKWKIASAPNGLGATPISIYYTTNESTFTPVALNIANTANSGCTVDGTIFSGCYKWASGSPASTYFKIRVAVTDLNLTVALSSAPANNPGAINFLAGNTEPGLGGSALSAMFYNYTQSADMIDSNSFVVTTNGTIYFRDYQRGLMIVNPLDGVQRLLIPLNTSGSSGVGDGGPITGATLRQPVKIAIDYQDRVLIFDYDRIRRIETSTNPMTISTIIGGGASSADGVAPTAVNIIPNGSYSSNTSNAILIPLPNGDIIFTGDNYGNSFSAGNRIRRYRQAQNDVISTYPNGTGCIGNPTTNVSNMSMSNQALAFDPLTSAVTHLNVKFTDINFGCRTYVDPTTGSFIAGPSALTERNIFHTGMNGKIYGPTRHNGLVQRFDLDTNTVTTILGTGVKGGNCPDGTIATSCPVDLLSFFVGAGGEVYFVDKGRIRTIDSENKVRTLAGQTLSHGDGANALSARFNDIFFFDQKTNGDIIVMDRQEFRLREFSIGGNIQSIAGTGANQVATYGLPAVSQPVPIVAAGPSWDDFVINPANGDVFFMNGSGSVGKLNRSTGVWDLLVGGGPTSYITGDGLLGSQINWTSNYPGRVLGFNGSQILVIKHGWNGTTFSDSFLKLLSITDGTQTHLAGYAGPTVANFSTWTSGATISTLGVPNAYSMVYYSRAFWDSLDATPKWLMLTPGTAQIMTLVPGGTLGSLTSLSINANAFTYRRTADLSTNIVYYCGSNGTLRKRNLNTSTDTVLPITVPGLTCYGRTVLYNSSRDSLIFVYQQNGLVGIAEYKSP